MSERPASFQQFRDRVRLERADVVLDHPAWGHQVPYSGFGRYLKTVSAEHFAVDETRVAEDARFDGLYVLRTNTKLTPLQVMLRYRDLLRVEQLFRQAKAVLATRPIYHSSDMAIRGHVFCSFLALLLVKELEDRLHRHNIAAEWDDILRDLDRLQEIELEQACLEQLERNSKVVAYERFAVGTHEWIIGLIVPSAAPSP